MPNCPIFSCSGKSDDFQREQLEAISRLDAVSCRRSPDNQRADTLDGVFRSFVRSLAEIVDCFERHKEEPRDRTLPRKTKEKIETGTRVMNK